MSYIVHKAVTLGSVRAKRRRELSADGYLEENYIAQAKYDGCNTVAYVNDGVVEFKTRTGNPVHSLEHVGMAMLTFPGMKDGVYLGEAWAPDMGFSEISGIFRRQHHNEESCRLQFAIFDYLTSAEFFYFESSALGYANRVARMAPALGDIARHQNPMWLAESFGHIAESFPNTTAQHMCNQLTDLEGYDGLVLRDPRGGWEKGSTGTGGEIIKLKRKLSYDLRVKGVIEGKGKNAGRVGALVLDFRGADLRVGTGFTDDQRQQWWAAKDGPHWNQHYSNSDQIIGQIVEVEAMDYSSEGLLREPRFKGIRHDKLQPD